MNFDVCLISRACVVLCNMGRESWGLQEMAVGFIESKFVIRGVFCTSCWTWVRIDDSLVGGDGAK